MGRCAYSGHRKRRAIDKKHTAQNLSGVSRVFSVVAAFLVALWLPATLHCELEHLGWETLFSCAESATDQAAQDDCSDDACQTIESGAFAFSKSEFAILTAAPALACDCAVCVLTVVPPAPAPEISPIRQEETLPLQRTWQFALRTAAPPGAPSLLNS